MACAALAPALAVAADTGPLPSGAAPSLADCDVVDWQTVLQPSTGPTDARAVWLDRQQLQWPGVEPTAASRFRLVHSADGRLVLAKGQVVQGADAGFLLTAITGAEPAARAVLELVSLAPGGLEPAITVEISGGGGDALDRCVER